MGDFAAEHRYVFLAGDTYPVDQYVVDAVRKALEPAGAPFLGERDLIDRYGGGQRPASLDGRLDLLRRAVTDLRTDRPLVLIGRSSGGRIATLAATDPALAPAIRAVVCLGYPFKHPDRAPEPERWRHLSRLEVPTLILQGVRDSYGGPIAAPSYPRSASVTLELYDADHELRLAPQAWEAIGARIAAFAAAAARRDLECRDC
jgi:predicted alpha/beta-hydrolase family hydrolase